MFDIVMVEYAQFGFRESAGFDDAGVAVTIGKNESALIDERRDEPDVCGVPCSKGQCGFDLFEMSQITF